MVIMWSSLFILSNFFIAIKAFSLMDFPMEHPDDNIIFHSVLTDMTTSKQWHITESLAGVTQVHGKIQVSLADTSKFEIFYHADRDDHRLVIVDDSCLMSSYLDNSWSVTLPEANRPLINSILMLGPSLVYRLDTFAFTWDLEQGDDEEKEVRGVRVVSYSTLIGTSLKLIVYFKSQLDLEEGIRYPVRIVFEEGKSGSTSKTLKLVLDYYSQTSTHVNLDKFVEVTPGYGCTVYFQAGRSLPRVSSSQIHLISTETLQFTDKDPFYDIMRVEIFADLDMNYLKVNEGSHGSTYVETLYDTDLGIGYQFDPKSEFCELVPITDQTPGINSRGSLDMDLLLKIQGTVRYVGNIYMPEHWPFSVDYWESTVQNTEIRRVKFDKVVTTYFYAVETDEITQIKSRSRPVPTAIIRKGTSSSDSGKAAFYQRIDIHEFQDVIDEDQYKGAFQMNNCAKGWNQRKSLTLLISPQDSKALKFAEQNVHRLREGIRKAITDEILLSPLRIVNIDILFTEDLLKAILSIDEKPKLEDSFEREKLTIEKSLIIDSGFAFMLENAEECLKFLASNTNIKSVAYCESEGICIGIKDNSLIKKARTAKASDVCNIYMIPFGNLNHLKRQLPLKDIDEAFGSRIVGTSFELTGDNKVRQTYKIQAMADISDSPIEILKRQAFAPVKEGAKLNADQHSGLIKSISVGNYGDCYRSCERSDQLDCSVFSYCHNETQNSYECLVSSGVNITQDEDNFIPEPDCTIYKRNLLFDYKKLPPIGNTDLIDGTTGYLLNVEDCAVKCSQLTDCHRFDYCQSDTLCFLPDKVHHKSTHSRNLTDCDTYVLKTSNRFQITGSKLVTDVFRSETELDLDQCAVLCFRWQSESSQECRSFNFCDKGQTNLCQLSGTTVHDKGARLTDSSNCINYEIISTRQNGHEQLNGQGKEAGFGSGFIAMVILFVAIGLGFGAGSPFVYKKIKQKYSAPDLPLQRLS